MCLKFFVKRTSYGVGFFTVEGKVLCVRGLHASSCGDGVIFCVCGSCVDAACVCKWLMVFIMLLCN